MGVLNELKNRGVRDILIAGMAGLTVFPDAVKAVYPDTRVQLCIIHMDRNSTNFISYKDLKKVCADLKKIYSAATEDTGQQSLDEFGEKWKTKYPVIFKLRDSHRNDLIEFFKYPLETRKAVYTTTPAARERSAVLQSGVCLFLHFSVLLQNKEIRKNTSYIRQYECSICRVYNVLLSSCHVLCIK
jgi:transposase-like protein